MIIRAEHFIDYADRCRPTLSPHLFFFDFLSKKQRTNTKSERSIGCGLARSRRRKMYATKAVELGAHGKIFVKC